MFPFDIDDDEIQEELVENTGDQEYEIDFERGALTGRIISGKDAVIQRARIALGTDRYFYMQYSWQHGHELASLIGKGYSEDLLKSEVQRMLEDALLVDEAVTAVSNLSCKIDRDKLKATFTIETIYGSEVMNV